MKLLLPLLAATSVVAQSVIDYTKLPACAHQCAILGQAETGCVPPAAPVTSQAIYQSCVCQSTLLTQLHADGSQCSSVCSADDANKISQYYIALCNGPVVQPAATATATSTTATGTTKAATGTATAGAGAATQPVSTSKKNDYLSTHWRWIVMIIIIGLAMIIAGVGGTWLKRRHNRKKEAARANLAANDAPYNPPTPGSTSKYPSSQVESQMTMSGGRNGMSAIGAARPGAMRSRSSTLQSMGLGNSSRTHIPQPVVWGPHQHLAHANANASNASPSNSVPPSPTVAMTPAEGSFRNRDAMRSDPRVARRLSGHMV